MQAVHSGADLESAIANCMGYKSEVTRQIRSLLLILFLYLEIFMQLIYT